jgi:hypothetical protein
MDLGRALQERLGIRLGQEPHGGIYHPAGSPYTVKKRWHFHGADGGQYEVAVSGPTLLARLLHRAPIKYSVAYSSNWGATLLGGDGVRVRITDGWLESYPTYDQACSCARQFIEQRQRGTR